MYIYIFRFSFEKFSKLKKQKKKKYEKERFNESIVSLKPPTYS